MGQCACFQGLVQSAVPPLSQRLVGTGAVQADYVQSLQPTAAAPIPTGRRRALLVGCNYFGTEAELAGCINDVFNVRDVLKSAFQWRTDSEHMRVLVDDGSGDGYPTRDAILSSLKWLVEGAQPGDALFFSYSGHGAQEVDPNGFEEDGMNETILPCDFQEAGMISDDVLTEYCVQPLPEGVKLTSIMDCCHSGTGLDLAWMWQSQKIWREDINPFHVAADVQMISGCSDEQTSADGARDLYGRQGGALTTAFCDVIRNHYSSGGLSYELLLDAMQDHIYSNGFTQNPQLTSSQAFDARIVPFSLQQCQMNANAHLGRIFRQKFTPQPRPMSGPLADMLDDLGMLVMQEEVLEAVTGDGTGDFFGSMVEGLLGDAGALVDQIAGDAGALDDDF